MRIPKIVFFDFDGVILESADIKTEAFKELFSFLDDQNREKAIQYHLDNFGISRYEKIKWVYLNLLDQSLSEIKLEELANRFSSIVFQRILTAPFVNGAVELLQFLNDNKVSCIVASGTPEDELKDIIWQRGISQYFEGIAGSPRKKSQIVNEYLIEFEISKDESLFIGDANTDYEAAKETQIKFAARLTPAFDQYWKNIEGITKIQDMHELLVSFRN